MQVKQSKQAFLETPLHNSSKTLSTMQKPFVHSSKKMPTAVSWPIEMTMFSKDLSLFSQQERWSCWVWLCTETGTTATLHPTLLQYWWWQPRVQDLQGSSSCSMPATASAKHVLLLRNGLTSPSLRHIYITCLPDYKSTSFHFKILVKWKKLKDVSFSSQQCVNWKPHSTIGKELSEKTSWMFEHWPRASCPTCYHYVIVLRCVNVVIVIHRSVSDDVTKVMLYCLCSWFKWPQSQKDNFFGNALNAMKLSDQMIWNSLSSAEVLYEI